MKSFTITPTDAPVINFTGRKIAEVSNEVVPTHGYLWRWDEFVLYETKGGKFVCCRIEWASYSDTSVKQFAKVCETHEEIISFFGYYPLAKELYDVVGISYTIEVE